MDDDKPNNLLVTGSIVALLRQNTTIAERSLTSVEVVTDTEGNGTNQIDITLSFMMSPYRITVERVADTEPRDEIDAYRAEQGWSPTDGPR